ncbi:THUMP domain-containing class I SAM-dependent RNA methyltransferase [Hypnocyclicus thermotrophus]|uniref:THUMP domain-containing class I SAM-dependent RNA methyltransferase n=1 Tax=Hypnocyclicus thermotrophus TaxID=1627895 RepID=UPI001AB049E4|nr:class I SAM-dependent RNA methyltransferase [Hypnocyclicus thermotrophus]
MTLIATTTMGLEAIVKKELLNLGYTDFKVFDGQIEINCRIKDIPILNISLRCADRIYLKMGEFKATTFEELFQNTKRLSWGEILPVDANFPISWISSVKSKLFSKRDSQSIIKKAIVEKLKEKYKVSRFEEDGASYKIKVQIKKDIVKIMIDTSGDPLHKRGYRAKHNEAPIKETLAAALVYLANAMKKDIIIDPTCGTGTLLIEAAMIAKNIMPGVNRNFVSEKWNIIDENIWIDVRDKAFSNERTTNKKFIGYDIDKSIVDLAIENAENAYVDDIIIFKNKDLRNLKNRENYTNGVIISNPPYGVRLEDEDYVINLYKEMGLIYKKYYKDFEFYLITSNEDFERYFGKKSDKNRKLYNGGIKCYYYQYFNRKQKNN